METYIITLRREGLSFNVYNDPVPDNVMQFDDVLPTTSSLKFGFHGVYPWHKSGKFLFGRVRLKMTPKPRIQHISCLDFFMKSYFMEYIKYLVIPETNKHLNSDMNLSDYFHVIGCHLIMACYVGHSVRDLFLKDTITTQKGAPIRLNYIIS